MSVPLVDEDDGGFRSHCGQLICSSSRSEVRRCDCSSFTLRLCSQENGWRWRAGREPALCEELAAPMASF